MKTRLYVVRKQWTAYSAEAPQGSGYCEEHYDRQYLTKEWSLFGIVVWRWAIDSEDVPVYAWVQVATLGSTDWKSKFHKYIV